MKFKVLLACAALAVAVAACRKRSTSVQEAPAVAPQPPSAGVVVPAGPPGTAAQVEPGSPEHGNLTMLTFAVQQFQGEKGRLPADLNELVSAGLVQSIPPAPVGLRYKIDPKTRNVMLTR